jgi:hypothetical protein
MIDWTGIAGFIITVIVVTATAVGEFRLASCVRL